MKYKAKNLRNWKVEKQSRNMDMAEEKEEEPEENEVTRLLWEGGENIRIRERVSGELQDQLIGYNFIINGKEEEKRKQYWSSWPIYKIAPSLLEF